MKKLVFLSMLFLSMFSIAQENYTRVIMPKTFDIFKNENQYNINSLCQSFFETEGFVVSYQEDLSDEDYYQNKCNYLYVDLADNGSMLNTKVIVYLKDCKKQVVLQSREFKTKEKDLNKAFYEVVKLALIDLRGKLNIPNKNSSATEAKANSSEVITIKSELTNSTNNTLSAEITKNGYNLLDDNKNVIFELLKTSNPSVFTAKKGNETGVLTLNGNKAKFESYQNNVLVVEEFQVKF